MSDTAQFGDGGWASQVDNPERCPDAGDHLHRVIEAARANLDGVCDHCRRGVVRESRSRTWRLQASSPSPSTTLTPSIERNIELATVIFQLSPINAECLRMLAINAFIEGQTEGLREARRMLREGRLNAP